MATVRRSRAALLLLLLPIAGLLLASGSVPHLHLSGDFGLWNQEHDASLLAAHGTSAALPDVLPVLAALLVVALAPRAPARRSPDAPRGLTDSRAPPLR